MINLQNLLDDAKYYETVRQLRWPDGARCPHCGGIHRKAPAPGCGGVVRDFENQRCVHPTLESAGGGSNSMLWFAQAPHVLAQGTGKGVVGGLYDESLRGLLGTAIDQGKGQSNHEDGCTKHRRHGATRSGEQEIGGRGAGGHLRV